MATSLSDDVETETFIRALNTRGWCFRDLSQINALIAIQLALHGDSCTVDSIESEVSNMDLRSFGGKSLPDSSLLRKSPHLLGPKVLQISSARDISRSSIAESWGNSDNHRRLLRLKLTDGHSEITAIEYAHIPSLPDSVVPGTKVCLKNKAVIHCGIVCLNPGLLTVLGGIVQSLHEEWQMNQKYSGLSRSSLRLARSSGAVGPPPFEKLQIRAPLHHSTQQVYAASTSKSSGFSHMEKSQHTESRQMSRLHINDSKPDSVASDVKSAADAEIIEEKPSSSEARPKEVVDYVPVQNQAASQKLLQKMSQPNRDFSHSRGRKHKGKERPEEKSLLTLDEWEKRKAGVNFETREDLHSISQDEDLAWKLQAQFDLEDLDVQTCPGVTEAENIRMNMFNFERNDAGTHGRTGFRGRGRGKGRGRTGRRGRHC